MKTIYTTLLIAGTIIISIFLCSASVNRPKTKKFTVTTKNFCTKLTIDPAEEPVIKIAAKLFAADVKEISGKTISIGLSSNATSGIIAGTLGKSKLIDEIIQREKLNLDSIKGKWEAFHIEVIEQKNGEPIMLIVGSDRRGTAYGILELSRIMGVSPWTWWADVHPEKKETIVLVLNGPINDAPDITYRGIFLNDEDWGLKPWSEKTFEPEVGDPGPKTYGKIFELLLRLRANTIWPAMHEVTKSFHTIPGNREKADSFAIVISTSHCEQMLRSNTGEWNVQTMGPFNYLTNRQKMYDYWDQRVKETTQSENIYTLGLRGVHDGKMEGANTVAEQSALMRQAVDDQRGMIKKYFTKPINQVPQIFIPYKEVLDVYDSGFEVPEDVTLIWCDDNYGFIRRLSNEQEQKRSGGSGVYYHVSYWGRPHDYIWLSSTQPALIWFEMRKAWEYGARRQWILNVGDIKPAEYLIEFYMDMAWGIDKFNADNIPEHLNTWTKKIFGEKEGKEIAGTMQNYYNLAFTRRPEFMGWSQTEPTTQTKETEFNPFEFNNEAEERVEAYRKIENKSIALADKIPARLKDAYYQLVEYPVRGASLMNRKWIYAQLANQYLSESLLTGKYAIGSLEAYKEIETLTQKYNEEIAGGKWKEMMSMAPRKLPVFNKPDIPQSASLSPEISQSTPKIAPTTRKANTETDKAVVLIPTGKKDGSNGVNKWMNVRGLGQSRNSNVVYPFQTKLSSFVLDNPCLEYRFTTQSTGQANLFVAMLPTHPVDGKSDVRYAISLDGKEPQIISFRTYDRDEQWKINVLRNQALTKTIQTIEKAGPHTLRIFAMDPGTALDQVMLDFKLDRKFYEIPEATL